MKKGFTLIEIMLAVAIIGILAGLSIPFLMTFKTSYDLDSVTEEMVSVLRKAEEKSIAAEKDSFWGVNFSQPSRYILFRLTFKPGDPENEIYEYPQNIILTTSSPEVKFSKLSGEVEDEFTISLTSFNKTRRIVINKEGTIDYFKQ